MKVFVAQQFFIWWIATASFTLYLAKIVARSKSSQVEVEEVAQMEQVLLFLMVIKTLVWEVVQQLALVKVHRASFSL